MGFDAIGFLALGEIPFPQAEIVGVPQRRIRRRKEEDDELAVILLGWWYNE